MKLIHKNIKAYECETCENYFGEKGALEMHVKTVHEKNQSLQM